MTNEEKVLYNGEKSEVLRGIGESIRKLRKEQGFTQEQLAEKANLSSIYISEVERGGYAISIISLIDICNALKVSPEKIVSNFLCFKIDNDNSKINHMYSKLNKKDRAIIMNLINFLNLYE